jgi:vancomycin resistance protein VanJ
MAFNRTSALLVVLSAALLSLAFCYSVQPDSLAAITFWPFWLWALPGLFLTAICCRHPTKRPALAAALLWLLLLAVFTEEPRSLLRSVVSAGSAAPAGPGSPATFRLVSLNCAGGSPQAAVEVIPYQPDIVVLQESPTREEVAQLARDLFGHQGSFVWNLDTSIIARGGISAPVPRRNFVHARVSLLSGRHLDVIGVRLPPPALRLDLWSPACWRDYAANRRARRAAVQGLTQHLLSQSADLPLLLAGDFNTPAHDAALRPLRARLRDAFRQAGLGWGDTVLNAFPISRFDQAWISPHLRATAVRAHQTFHSDHRMLVCDLVFADPTAP